MGKKITIYRGDEYRAKIERTFEPDDIFADIYFKAGAIVKKITGEMQEYKKQQEREGKKRKKYAMRYAGMGNNLILFCGGRGQGKTSAMQTFAEFLGGRYQEEEKGKLSEIVEDEFEVLGTIDPSAMENGESILRVLLSRLFFQLQECIAGANPALYKENDFAKQKADIVKLFQKCYENIDYIKAGKGGEYERDDLEMLSQLGSSAKLKENLHNLIDMYLTMMSYGKSNSARKYLVIPVDDADLATKKVFRLCEDIRNYLSIPNVIILMAADYEQLVNATYLKYLKQYKAGLDAAVEEPEKARVADDCYEMAAKYIEKVFPAGHRVDLPQIDYLLAESYEEIKFEYRVPDENHKGQFLSAFKEADSCKNIQEQLLLLLYVRTGIVLVGEKEAMHAFLPHTFRELTHFVKLLYDMHGIYCDEIYRNYERRSYAKEAGVSKEWKQKVQWLKENILMVKRYFMNYWCEKNLNASEVRAIQELEDANQRHQMAEVCTILSRCFDDAYFFDKTYGGILQMLADSRIETKPRLQKAVGIYYTFFLNGWFAAALERRAQFSEIAKFVGKSIAVSDEFLKCTYMGQFQICQFKVVKEDLKQIKIGTDRSASKAGQSIEEMAAGRAALEACCTAWQRGKKKSSIPLFQKIGGKMRLNSAIGELEVNILSPILYTLTNKTVNAEADSQGKRETSSVEEENIHERSKQMTCLVSVRNIIANCDMQLYLRDELDVWCGKQNGENSKDFQWLDVWEELYGEIDAILDKITYLNYKPISQSSYSKVDELIPPVSNQSRRSEISSIYEALYKENASLMNALFLCNEDNRNQYVENRKEEIQTWINRADEQMFNKWFNFKPKDEAIAQRVRTEIDELLAEKELLPDWMEGISLKSGADLRKLEALQEKMAGKAAELKEIQAAEAEDQPQAPNATEQTEAEGQVEAQPQAPDAAEQTETEGQAEAQTQAPDAAEQTETEGQVEAQTQAPNAAEQTEATEAEVQDRSQSQDDAAGEPEEAAQENQEE